MPDHFVVIPSGFGRGYQLALKVMLENLVSKLSAILDDGGDAVIESLDLAKDVLGLIEIHFAKWDRETYAMNSERRSGNSVTKVQVSR